MKINFEKVFNALFPFLIIGTTIIVILFSRGWRIDLEEKTVISTGILDITSDPRNATIYIDGEEKGKTPTIIDSLEPGKYKLELRKEYYSNWSKEIEIKEEYVTQITANLFEEEKQLQQISETPIENVIFSPKGDESLIVTTINNEQGLWKIQLNQSFFQLEKTKIKITDLIEPEFFDLLTTNYKIKTNRNFSRAVLSTNETDKSERHFLLNLDRENSDIIEITEFIGNNEIYDWTANNNFIYIEGEKSLKTLNTETLELATISNWPVTTWDSSSELIFFLQKNELTNEKVLYQSNLNGTERKEYITQEQIKSEINTINKIVYNQEYKVLFISNSTQTEIFDPTTLNSEIILESSTAIQTLSPDQRFLIIKESQNMLTYTYDFEEKILIPFVEEYSTNIDSYIWTPNSLKLFFRNTDEQGNNQIASIDYDGTNHYEIYLSTNYNGELDNKLGFSNDSKKIYFPLSVNLTQETEEETWEEYLFEITLR